MHVQLLDTPEAKMGNNNNNNNNNSSTTNYHYRQLSHLSEDFKRRTTVAVDDNKNMHNNTQLEESPLKSWYYVDHLPIPGHPWPFFAPLTKAAITDKINHPTTSNLTLATGIPALYKPEENGGGITFLQTQLHALLQSIAEQSVRADEVVLVVSNVPKNLPNSNKKEVTGNHNGTDICRQLYNFMVTTLNPQQPQQQNATSGSSTTSYSTGTTTNSSTTFIQPRVLCVGQRLTAGLARNAVGKIAQSDILSFVDSDDTEMPQRNQVTKHYFACHRDTLFMILHQFVRQASDMESVRVNSTAVADTQQCQLMGHKVIPGSRLYDIMQETHARWWLRKDIAHGHIVIDRRLMTPERGGFQFSSIYKGEDSAFVRDVLYAFGRNSRAVVYLAQQLTSYVQSNQANTDLITKTM
jgi:hypothetical protein